MKINEAILSNVLPGITGAVSSAAKGLKGLVSPQPGQNGFNALGNWMKRRKSGLSPEDQLAYDNFVKKFVSRGVNAINTAAKAGLIDTTSNVMTAPQAIPVATAATLGLTPSGQVPKQPTQATQQSTPQPSTKPRVRINPQTGQMQPAPTTNTAQPLTATWAGIKYKKSKKGWVAQNSRGSVRKGEVADADTARSLDMALAQALPEAIAFIKMNKLFESLVNESQPVSISQWVKNNFVVPSLKGIDWMSAESQIDDILKNLPNSYRDGTLAQDLAKIADIAWAIEIASGRK